MSNIVTKNFMFSIPFLRGYRELRIPVVDASGNPAWPDMFPIAKINEMRDIVGLRHFAAQMMLEFVAPDRVRLDPGALRLYTDGFDAHTARIGDTIITGVAAYWDPSSGRRHADGSVCVLLYRDDKNHIAFIHDVRYLTVDDNDTHPLARQCDMVLDFMAAHGVRRISIEVNGIGNALPEIMRDVAVRRGVSISIQPIANTRSKETRILDAIEPMLTTGRLYANAALQGGRLFAEMLGWTPLGSAHDDGLDALAGALCATPTPVRAMGAAIRPYRANTNFNL